MHVRYKAGHGARRKVLLDNPAHGEYNDYWHVCVWFYRNGPVQVPRCATERRFVSGDDKPDTNIWHTEAVTKR